MLSKPTKITTRPGIFKRIAMTYNMFRPRLNRTNITTIPSTTIITKTSRKLRLRLRHVSRMLRWMWNSWCIRLMLM